ncbi:MAG: hypothetical protein R2716_01840 [Microthrixaceae bacterium]
MGPLLIVIALVVVIPVTVIISGASSRWCSGTHCAWRVSTARGQ